MGLGHNEVCGENGKTYTSICALHKAYVNLAYTGQCKPEQCTKEVCGRNGITYKSRCHAISHSAHVDYNGICFTEKE